MDKLHIGIIGCGYWGPNLIRNISSCPSTEAVAIYDACPAHLEAIGRTYNHLQLTGSLEQLLEQPIQAVAIATPVSTHFSLAERCLEAGLHVLVEKPMASTVHEAQVLIDLASRQQRILMVDHTYLFNNSVRRIKELVEYGELGNLYYVDSIRINLGLFQHDINVIWDLAPHDLSIVDYVLGGEARSISAWGCRPCRPRHRGHRLRQRGLRRPDAGELPRQLAVAGEGTTDDLRGVSQELDLQRAQHRRADQSLRPGHRAGRRPGRGSVQAHDQLSFRRRLEPAHRAGRGAFKRWSPTSPSASGRGRPRSATGRWGCAWSVSWRRRPGAFGPKGAASFFPTEPAPMGAPTHERTDPANFIRIAPDVRIGRNVAMHCFVNLYGCRVGDDTRIGSFVEVQKNASIGARCKIQSHTFVCEGVTIEDEVFVGHGVVFINDRDPRAVARGMLQTEADWKLEPTRVCRGASIGSGALILGGVTIGAGTGRCGGGRDSGRASRCGGGWQSGPIPAHAGTSGRG